MSRLQRRHVLLTSVASGFTLWSRHSCPLLSRVGQFRSSLSYFQKDCCLTAIHGSCMGSSRARDIAEHPMPSDMQRIVDIIMCNDCEIKSHTRKLVHTKWNPNNKVQACVTSINEFVETLFDYVTVHILGARGRISAAISLKMRRFFDSV